MNHRLRFNRQDIFRLLVILVWTQTILLQYLRAVIMRSPLIGSYSDEVILVFYIAVVIIALPYYKINKKDLLFISVTAVVFMLEWIFYKDGRKFLNRYMADFVVKILPLYVLGISLSASKEKETIIHQLYILSIMTLVTNIFYQYAFGTPMSEVASQYEGDMDLAYNLLPHCCLIAYYAVKKSNAWNVVFTVIGAFYLLMLGTRGAALIYLICIALLLIMGRTSKWTITRVAVIFGAIAAFVASPLYDAAILWMYQRAQHYGLSVRIFDKLISGTVNASSGRDTIREALSLAIKKNPIFGYGICSDRVLVGTYAHNIVIELMVEYGVIIGTAIFAVLVMVLLRGYWAAKDEGEKGLIFTLIFASFCKLFLSGSYLDERLLFLLLGMCVYSIRRSKQNMHRRYSLKRIKI